MKLKTKLVLGGIVAAAAMLFSTEAMLAKPPAPIMKMLDGDNDGTLDLDEMKRGAETIFARIERDHDGTLDQREAGIRIGPKMFKDADPDKDGTLSKDEYLALTETLFKAADPDGDGTLDAKELRSAAGRAVSRLVY